MFAKSFVTILTICLASFTTLAAQRSGVSQSPWSPARSYCDHCHHPLTWWQLVPILGWVVQGGRCHFCRQRITAYDPLCELIGGLFAWRLAAPGLFHSLLVVLVIQALLFIASCDYFYQYLYPLSLAGLIPLPLLIPSWGLTPARIVITLTVTSLLTITAVRWHWLGGGDVPFITILLLTFGVEASALAILLASLLTLIAFLHSHRDQLPFLPALCLATLIILSTY